MGSRWIGLVVVVVLLASSVRAVADDVSAAREHAQKAKRAFELGLYDEAIAEYNAAYKAKDDPALFYNLGQAYRLAGRPQEALRSYRLYLNKSASITNRDNIEKWIVELQKQIDAKAKAEPPPKPEPVVVKPPPPQPEPVVVPAPPPPPPKPEPVVVKPRPSRVMLFAGIGTLAAGVVLIAGGGAAYALAEQTGTQLLTREEGGGAYDASLYKTGETRVLAGNLCMGIGGAAVIAGAVVTALGAKKGKAQQALHIVPGAGRDRASLQIGGSF